MPLSNFSLPAKFDRVGFLENCTAFFFIYYDFRGLWFFMVATIALRFIYSLLDNFPKIVKGVALQEVEWDRVLGWDGKRHCSFPDHIIAFFERLASFHF